MLVAALSHLMLVAPVATPAATLYTGARIVTLDAAVPVARAVLVSDGVIKQVYAAEPPPPAGVTVVKLEGGVLVPGLHDAHAHLAGLGRNGAQVALEGTRSAAEVVAAVKAWRASHPGAWLVGRGWDQNDWPCATPAVQPCGGTLPTRALLDAAVPDVPVLLWRIDGHAAWVNTAAIKLATDKGSKALAPRGADPTGGRILREGDGTAAGVLVDTAMDLVSRHMPPPTPAELARLLEQGAQAAAAAGLTSFHDMGTSVDELAALRALEARGALPLRVFAYLDGADARSLEQLPVGGPRPGRSRVEVRGVKLYADGALGSRGAALLAPYADEPANSGLLVTPPDVLEKQARAAHDRGYQVAIHAIGDRGNRVVLDVFGRLGVPSRRHRVEHAQVVDPADFGRFKTLGVVASMQPTHCTSDMPWAEARLGSARLAGAYAWRSLAAAGAVLAFGSDAPVESVLPAWGLYAAVTRMDHAGKPAGGWRKAEALTPREALEAFTRGAAYAVGHEQDLGAVKAGMRADMSWLAEDPLEIPAAGLVNLGVRGTIVDGVLYRAAR